jgi:hypothetical protein
MATETKRVYDQFENKKDMDEGKKIKALLTFLIAAVASKTLQYADAKHTLETGTKIGADWAQTVILTDTTALPAEDKDVAFSELSALVVSIRRIQDEEHYPTQADTEAAMIQTLTASIVRLVGERGKAAKTAETPTDWVRFVKGTKFISKELYPKDLARAELEAFLDTVASSMNTVQKIVTHTPHGMIIHLLNYLLKEYYRHILDTSPPSGMVAPDGLPANGPALGALAPSEWIGIINDARAMFARVFSEEINATTRQILDHHVAHIEETSSDSSLTDKERTHRIATEVVTALVESIFARLASEEASASAKVGVVSTRKRDRSENP